MPKNFVVIGLFLFALVSFTHGGWVNQHTGANILFDLDFPQGNIQTGFACGENSFALKTTNGGQEWTSMRTMASGNLNAINFPQDDLNGFIACDSGNIQLTTDGGDYWELVNTGTGNNLYAIHFPVSSNFGVAVGAGGTIKRTNDGGRTWEDGTIAFNQDLTDVVFRNEGMGWVVGDNGTIAFSQDGGISWEMKTSNVNTRLLGVTFLDDNTGWVVGAARTCLKTTDGGQTWDSLPIPVPEGTDLYSIIFLDQDHGFACGTYGKIARTINGGATWDVTNLLYHFYRIEFPLDNLTGWVCGLSEAIFKTIDGGWLQETNFEPVVAERVIRSEPNPFRVSTCLKMSYPVKGITALKIYDRTGNLVRSLKLNDGGNTQWDGRNDSGLRVKSGVYLIEAVANQPVTARLKLVLLD